MTILVFLTLAVAIGFAHVIATEISWQRRRHGQGSEGKGKWLTMIL